MEVVSDLSTLLAAIASLGAVFIAVKALRATRNAPVADHLLMAYGEMLAALEELSAEAHALERVDPSLQSSRDALGSTFRRISTAEAKVDLIEPPVTRLADYGSWVRGVAHNLAVNLLQADEFAELHALIFEEDAEEMRPAHLPQAEWGELKRSLAYQSVLMVGLEPPSEVPKDFIGLEPWLRPRVKGFGDGTSWDDHHSVYSPYASYMTQHVRLLDDFVREYLVPWARDSVREALD